jgi:hypothetical protein
MVKKNKNPQDINKNLTHNDVPASVGLVKEVREELRSEIRMIRNELGGKIEQVLVSVHQTQVLMEEQRGENRIVLDGLKNVTERQDRMEGDILDIKSTLRSFKSLGT